MASFDVVIRGGRVIDPETGFDATCNVGIAGRAITSLTAAPLEGKRTLEAGSLVVAPGFVDLHSHAQTLAGRRLRVCDGVTTALDLEAGRAPVKAAYATDEREGSPIHFGYSASWTIARAAALGIIEPDGKPGTTLELVGGNAWRGELSREQRTLMLGLLAEELADGAVGIGFLLGYAPEVGQDEYIATCRLASGHGLPTFTHCRELMETAPHAPVDGPEEVVRAAAETGGHGHLCHVNSSAARHIDRVLALIERSNAEGGTVSYEAYPYGYASTAIGAPFLSPEGLAAYGLGPSALTYLPTGERVADVPRLEQLRKADPGGLVLMDFLDENDARDRAVLRRSLTSEGAIVASDAMPLVPKSVDFDEELWPIGESAVTHPRTAGCYSRALRMAREDGLPLAETLARCSLLPARVLEACCPDMKRKGRVQIGCDADLVIFDAERVSDEAWYGETTRVSSGIRHVLVDGVPVVSDGTLDLGARPGRPIRAG